MCLRAGSVPFNRWPRKRKRCAARPRASQGGRRTDELRLERVDHRVAVGLYLHERQLQSLAAPGACGVGQLKIVV